MSDIQNPLKEIIDNDLCTGCWVCAVFDKSPYTIQLDKFGMLKAKFSWNKWLTNKESKDIEESCPFSDEAKNEDELSDIIFDKEIEKKEYVGHHIWFYAGHVSQWSYREKWSSWGMWTWILSELLNEKLVDKVIHVKSTENSLIFEYNISESHEELQIWAKSKYYPITLFDMLTYIKNNDYRYAVVWIPCFLKWLRLYAEKNSLVKSRIHFTMGLVCWHLKSQKFWEMLAWQVWVQKKDLKAIDFREKNLSKSADAYNFSATNKDGVKKIKNMKEMFGWNWWANFFKYKACDLCDDTFAEVADVTIGDAWIQPYTKEALWNNVVITRNKVIDKLLKKAITNKRLKLDIITYDQIVASQKAWINHKNKWLAYRLKYTKENITKRVSPSNKWVSLFYKCIFRLRVILRDFSHIFYHVAEKLNSFTIFRILIWPTLLIYYSFYFFVFLKNKITRTK